MRSFQRSSYYGALQGDAEEVRARVEAMETRQEDERLRPDLTLSLLSTMHIEDIPLEEREELLAQEDDIEAGRTADRRALIESRLQERRKIMEKALTSMERWQRPTARRAHPAK